MAIAKNFPLFIKSLLLTGALSLVACGGGSGGGSDKKPTPDTTPNAFTFTASTEAQISTNVTSPTITISGIDAAAPVSITGGEYSISGGAFTSTAGTISNGQTLAVRITTSDKTNTPKEATVTVGGVSAKFSATTAADVTPDAFSFAPKNEVAVDTEQTSEAITVKGIDIAVPVSITGGSYSINNVDFTSAVGTVSAGQTITVKTTSGSKTEASTSAVLTIGGVTGTFTVTTVTDTFAPVAEFKFPSPYTMSEANEVKVRGTATDENAITDVKLVVRSFNLATPEVTISTKDVTAVPKSETNGVKDFSSWTATIPLTTNAENEIKVVAKDDRNNEVALDDANKVIVRQADVSSAFPDEVNQFVWLPESITLDQRVGRNHLIMSDHDKDIIYSINLNTGERTEFLKIKNNDCSSNAEGIVLDYENNKLYAVCNLYPTILLQYDLNSGELEASYGLGINTYINGMIIDRNGSRNQLVLVTYILGSGISEEERGSVIKFDLDSKKFSIISSGTDQETPIVEAKHISVDGDRYLISSGEAYGEASTRKIISVNSLTGARSILSSNVIGLGDLFSSNLANGWTAELLGLHTQSHLGRVLVNELGGKLFSIDLSTGNRSIFKDLTYVQISADQKILNQDVTVDENTNVAFVDDQYRQSILIIDLETREKVILSKSKNDF